MKVWVADNGRQLWVFDSHEAAWAWIKTFSASQQNKFHVWCLNEREKAK